MGRELEDCNLFDLVEDDVKVGEITGNHVRCDYCDSGNWMIAGQTKTKCGSCGADLMREPRIMVIFKRDYKPTAYERDFIVAAVREHLENNAPLMIMGDIEIMVDGMKITP